MADIKTRDTIRACIAGAEKSSIGVSVKYLFIFIAL